MENRSFIKKYFSGKYPQGLKSKSIFIISGIAATLWFLSRVIPKPSRAYYPCVQATAPVMAGFVVYLLSITGSMVVLKRIRVLLKNRKYLLAFTMTLVFLFLAGLSFIVYSPSLEAKEYAGQDDFAPNQPMGIGQGVNPGRVVWVWDKQVTNENCAQTTNRNGFWMMVMIYGLWIKTPIRTLQITCFQNLFKNLQEKELTRKPGI
jgi:hypothetical protein